MPFLAIVLLFFCFFKTLSYGIYELKYKKNKPGGFSVILYSILRAYIPINIHYSLLHLLNYSPLPSGNAG